MIALLVEWARAEFRGENADDSEPPEQIGYLWYWFNDLTDWRDNAFGVGALSHQEIEAWARLFRIEISPFEVDALRRLDREFRSFQHEKNNPAPVPIGEQMRELAVDLKSDKSRT